MSPLLLGHLLPCYSIHVPMRVQTPYNTQIAPCLSPSSYSSDISTVMNGSLKMQLYVATPVKLETEPNLKTLLKYDLRQHCSHHACSWWSYLSLHAHGQHEHVHLNLKVASSLNDVPSSDKSLTPLTKPSYSVIESIENNFLSITLSSWPFLPALVKFVLQRVRLVPRLENRAVTKLTDMFKYRISWIAWFHS
jgi:hypothetical protein